MIRNTPILKTLLIFFLFSSVLGRSYPLFKQCDPRWSNQQIGTSSNTICKSGDSLTSLCMALVGINRNFNPSTLNNWLKQHNCYVNGDQIIWGCVLPEILRFRGKLPNSKVKQSLDGGDIVIITVHNGSHKCLAHGYSSSEILVNDPGYTVTSYSINSITDGENIVYEVIK